MDHCLKQYVEDFTLKAKPKTFTMRILQKSILSNQMVTIQS